jgi:glutamate-5-semialdehyde dehydrogenase
MDELTVKGQKARAAAFELAALTTQQKNQALLAVADEVCRRESYALEENEKDLAQARA